MTPPPSPSSLLVVDDVETPQKVGEEVNVKVVQNGVSSPSPVHPSSRQLKREVERLKRDMEAERESLSNQAEEKDEEIFK